MKKDAQFYLVQYTQLFDPTAHTEIIVTNDFDRWKSNMKLYQFSYCEEITFRRASEIGYKCTIRICYFTSNGCLV